jgi:hypothetical protein
MGNLASTAALFDAVSPIKIKWKNFLSVGILAERNRKRLIVSAMWVTA